ncbi:ABC transporter ATP-binding protein [Paraliobacillus quinghaiensis]|uniref:ABC transporter ATP-binding protein n=1 Tax=Paraliobacillus quinghaiensis TaxID=470815 RepID=A0A917TX84_9BACI|nr:ABC transporter ATP-binding protein [Paraliobacillus quinghaiensis]GGM42093.1 ABC transporter ATP-binding protein [Paraliobacillus quinghaiensis]
MLNLEGVHAYYGYIHALKGVSLKVEEGSIVTLLGANGAGKTTILKVISGVLKASSGSVTFLDHDISKLAPEKVVSEGIVQAPEGRQIFPELTVIENLQVGAYTRRDKKNIKSSYQIVFDYFPILKERQDQLAGTLSGGEQQMLAIGRALMAKPKVLLLDEPSLGLAPLIVKDIFKIIQEINAQGTTVFLVEQNANQALAISDYAYVLETGKITVEGKASEIKEDPKVLQAYLGGH